MRQPWPLNCRHSQPLLAAFVRRPWAARKLSALQLGWALTELQLAHWIGSSPVPAPQWAGQPRRVFAGPEKPPRGRHLRAGASASGFQWRVETPPCCKKLIAFTVGPSSKWWVCLPFLLIVAPRAPKSSGSGGPAFYSGLVGNTAMLAWFLKIGTGGQVVPQQRLLPADRSGRWPQTAMALSWWGCPWDHGRAVSCCSLVAAAATPCRESQRRSPAMAFSRGGL